MATTTSFYKKPPTFPTLVYPDDGKADNFYPDCVCFTIQKRTGVSIDAVVTAASKMVETAKKAWEAAGVPKELQSKLKAVQSTKKSTKEIEEESNETIKKHYNGNPPANMLELIGASFAAFGTEMGKQQKAARDLGLGKGGSNILGSIYLNMPNGIQFNESANWGGQELGFMGKMAQDFVSGQGAAGDVGKTMAGAAAGSAGGMIGAAVGAIPSLVSKLGISGGMFGAAIGAMAAGSPIQKGFESALGVAQNPYMEMMFSGIGFREFQFEFILRPKSTTEVDTVAQILRMFRTFTKPTFSEGALGKSFMDYPMEFGIKFLTGVNSQSFESSFSDNTNVPKLKNCVCDNVTSNFTPQSIWAAHKGGVPLAVTLGLSFQETELVMAEDVYKEKY